jgi:hypothetical protein
MTAGQKRGPDDADIALALDQRIGQREARRGNAGADGATVRAGRLHGDSRVKGVSAEETGPRSAAPQKGKPASWHMTHFGPSI